VLRKNRKESKPPIHHKNKNAETEAPQPQSTKEQAMLMSSQECAEVENAEISEIDRY
jgi:hypothetical protein